MVYAPTGSGKTGPGCVYRRRPRLVVVCVFCLSPRIRSLINQTAQRFTEYGLPEDQISFIWRDHPNYDPNLLIQIASADTLIRREFPKNIDLLIVDEAHLRKRRILKEIERITAEKKSEGYRFIWYPFAPFLGPLLSTPD